MENACGEINVAFGSTGYGPLWAPCVSSWLRVVGYSARQFAIDHIGKIGGAGVTDRTYTANAENQLVEEMLNGSFTHLFMTESDMILPHDTITKLMALDKDIAGGIYFLRGEVQPARGQPCLYKKAPAVEWEKRRIAHENGKYLHTPVSLFPRDTAFPVDHIGLGCALIKRHVFEGMKKPWFDVRSATEEQLTGYGSDMFFFTNVKAAGFEVWCDPTVLCGQIDYYITDIDDYVWQLENNPPFAGRGYIIGTGGTKLIDHKFVKGE